MNWKDLTSLFGARPQPPLPDSFLFGVATADHQCEAYRADCEDIRDVWERERDLVKRGQATNFERRYPEDVGLAHDLRCNAFRFSIAWSRVEPAAGQFDQAAFDHYRRLISAIRSAGQEPILTLHHFTWPVHVEQRGGMIADGFPEIYARYVAEVVKRFGGEVRYWITFNEPNQLIFGYLRPWWMKDYSAPPGLPDDAGWDIQIDCVGRLMRNLFLAHARAYGIIKSAHPEAQVGANPLLLGLPIWLQRLINWNAIRMKRGDLEKQGRRLAGHHPRDRGRVDMVIANLTRTPERERQVMFSDVYFTAGQGLLGREEGPAAGAGDLAGKGVAVVRGSTAKQNIRDLLPGSNAVVAKDYQEALRLLERSGAEAILADDTILWGLRVLHPNRYKLIEEHLAAGLEPYAVAVTRGDRELIRAIDQTIRDFKASGEWSASYTRNLGRPAPKMPPSPVHALSLSGLGREEIAAPEPAPEGTGQRRILDRGYLKVAVKQDVPGFGFRDPNTGEFSGLEIDLARAVAKRIFGDAERVRFYPAATAQRIPLLRSPWQYLDSLVQKYSILSTVFASNWWHLGMAGRLPDFLCPQDCIRKQDFVGLDYYWGIRTLRLDRIQALIDAGLGQFDRAPVWPGALYGHVRYLADLIPGKPLLIMENGSVDQADGMDRATYIRRHFRQVQRAARDGVNVTGYVCWAITSNREWGLAFGRGNDFGLYHIELDKDPDLKRERTQAAEEYQKIIASRGVDGAGKGTKP